MNYQKIEEQIKAGYRDITVQYRRDDEVEVLSANHRRLASSLQQICRSFDHPITALDVGCGTGRYFHCLENVRCLTGMDISEEMLAAAASPVLQEKITASEVRLVRRNIHLASFPAESFDFIYSLGMFGHGCPVTVVVCNKFHEWLRPGGTLFFNIVDFAGLPLWYRARRKARIMIYPVLPKRLQAVLDKREQRAPFFSLTQEQLEKIMLSTRLADFRVTSNVCQSPLWSGRHLECTAGKLFKSSAMMKKRNFEPQATPASARDSLTKL